MYDKFLVNCINLNVPWRYEYMSIYIHIPEKNLIYDFNIMPMAV